MRSLLRQAWAAVGSSLVAAAALVGCSPSDMYKAPDPPEVTVSPPVHHAITNYRYYTGSTKAELTVELRARVKGFLKERHFDEKQPVKKGQLLYVIDEEPFQVALDMAQAKLAESKAAQSKAEQSKAREVASATLALDQATLGLARIEERRSRTLLERNAGTREALDQAVASTQKAEAQVLADEASLEQSKADFETNILSAKANVLAADSDVRNARINLGYCRIFAPFDGRISRANVDVGNLVGDGSATVLATVYTIDPIFGYFSVGEDDLLLFRKLAREGKRKNFLKGDIIELELKVANEDEYTHKGVLNYTDPVVDAATGTIFTRGVFANPGPDELLRPGLFVKSRVPLEEKADATLVPEVALGRDKTGPYLLIVGPDDKVDQRRVTIGEQDGPYREILTKIGPDENVVVNGLQKARPGMTVKPILQAIKYVEPAAGPKAP